MNEQQGPKVCVAICNYNHSKYLNQSIQSIVSQTYDNLDIVVVDDGSDDLSAVKEIVNNQYDDRVRFISIEKNTGKWNALNAAFSTTDAHVCTSHDADDVSLPWRIQTQLSVMLETKTIHNLCGFVSCWSESDLEAQRQKLESAPESCKMTSGDSIPNLVLAGFNTPGINHFYTGDFETAGVSAMFHKRAWDLGFRFLPANQNLRVLMSEDSDFNFRITTSLRSTSILLETPYLYRRNTSTNKEEK